MNEIGTTGNFGNFFQGSAVRTADDVFREMNETDAALKEIRKQYISLLRGIYD